MLLLCSLLFVPFPTWGYSMIDRLISRQECGEFDRTKWQSSKRCRDIAQKLMKAGKTYASPDSISERLVNACRVTTIVVNVFQ